MSLIRKMIFLLFAACFIQSGFAAGTREYRPEPGNPDALELQAPVSRWDDGIPLGNGLTGALMWGGGSRLNLSLDRADLWDNRLVEAYKEPDWNYQTLISLARSGRDAELNRRFDKPYSDFAYPTKLPGGRLVLNLSKGSRLDLLKVDFREGIGRAYLAGGEEIRVIFSRTAPLFVIVMDEPAHSLDILVPGERREESGSMSYADFSSLDYPEAVEFSRDGVQGFLQRSLGSFAYMIAMKAYEQGGKYCIAVTLSAGDYDQPLDALYQESREQLDAVQQLGFQQLEEETRAWWSDFSRISSVRLNESGILRHYNFVRYLYGAGTGLGAPPMPLQGVWTADSAGLPPWKGDFHFDLNMQMNYWGCYNAGLREAAASFTGYMDSLIPAHRDFAGQFFGSDEGIAVPGVMTLDGKPMGGWAQYSLSPMHGAWVAQHYYWEWKYFNAPGFLEESAYPYAGDIALNLISLLKEDEHGNLKLPLSSSPEIFDNRPSSWLQPNSNYDQSLLIWLFTALKEMAVALDNGEVDRWEEILQKLEPLSVDRKGNLALAPGVRLKESHRHHSHLMGIYPLQTLDPQGVDRELVLASLDRLRKLGGSRWTGYSFSWAACMEAIAGRAEEADRYLGLFNYAFVTRNGFHVNGDQQGTGESHFTYRPFTLEGNFAAMQAVHLMMLQNRGDLTVLFPAVPLRWGDVSFEKLRVYGGASVSASLVAGEVAQLTFQSDQDCEVLISLERIPSGMRDKLLDAGAGESYKGVDAVRLNLKAGAEISF